MNLTLRDLAPGRPRTTRARMVTYDVDDVSPDMSFLEMLDVLNEQLILRGRRAGRVRPRLPRGHLRRLRHGHQRRRARPAEGRPPPASSTCGTSADGDTIDVEPWRARAFPVVKDLVVDRGAFDRIIQAGGYITAPTGSAPDAHATPVPKADADAAFEAAACIGCGACVAACPNGSGDAVHRREGHPPRSPAAGPARAADRACWTWSRHTTRRASAAAPTPASAPPSARRASRCRRSAELNRDYRTAVRSS